MTGEELRAALRAALSASQTWAVAVRTALWGGLSNVTWDPTQDSVFLTVEDDSSAAVTVASNMDARYSNSQDDALAVCGTFGAGRFVVWGGNPLHDLGKGNVPGGSGNAAFSSLVTRSVAWVLNGTGAFASGSSVVGARFNATLAHLPGASSYWFQHDVSTRAWLAAAAPLASINAVNACDGPDLTTSACLGRSQLLIIGRQMGTVDDSAARYSSTNATAVASAVASFLAMGGNVVYVQYDGGTNDLSTALMPVFGVSTAPTDNYWQVASLAAANASSSSGGMVATLGPLDRMLDTLTGVSPLTPADVVACVDVVARWSSCAASGWLSHMGSGLSSLRTSLTNMDTSGRPLFSLTGRTPLKLLVMLGDKYRGNEADAGTTRVAFPFASSNLESFTAAAFADASVHMLRATAPPAGDLGTLTCPRQVLWRAGCHAGGYDHRSWAPPPLAEGVVRALTIPNSDAWMSTGLYALSGRALTISRTDNAPAIAHLYFWFQRDAVTKAFSTSGGYSLFDRPQFPRSPGIPLPPGGTITVTPPYGGPLYLGITGAAAAAGQRVTFIVRGGIAFHPSILDISNETQISAFIASMASSPLPAVDLAASGFEMHMRKDKLLQSLAPPSDTSGVTRDYSGMSGLRAFLEDARFRFIEVVYTNANLKVPGKRLNESLPAGVRQLCAALALNCTDEALHVPTGIQHSNYDENAQCGNGCSGNPWDADWNPDPIGWGEAHELGHNLQRKALDIAYVASSLGASGRNAWANYNGRGGENSNNIHPYRTWWNYYRQWRNLSSIVLQDDHMNTKDVFVGLQSAWARINATVNGVLRSVVLREDCSIWRDFELGTPPGVMAAETFYSDGGYAADNGVRMAFLLQLPMLVQGRRLADNATVLDSGFDIFTLLYAGARRLTACGGDDASWAACRGALGMSTLPRTGDATYSGGDVRSMPGNDFLLIFLTRLTRWDWRPYWEVRGVPYSEVAARAVAAQAPRLNVSTLLYALETELPPSDLISGVPTVALDGIAAWPRGDGWQPYTRCMLGLPSGTPSASGTPARTASQSGSTSTRPTVTPPRTPSGTATRSRAAGSSPSTTATPAPTTGASPALLRVSAAAGTALQLHEALALTTDGALVSLYAGGATEARWRVGGGSWAQGAHQAADGCLATDASLQSAAPCGIAASAAAAPGVAPQWELAFAAPLPRAIGALIIVGAQAQAGRGNASLHRADGSELGRWALGSYVVSYVPIASITPAPRTPVADMPPSLCALLPRYVRVASAASEWLHFQELMVLDDAPAPANLALRMPAVSGSAPYTEGGLSYAVANGNDGVVDGAAASGVNLFHAGTTGGYWEVDLGTCANVTRLIMFNRASNSARLAGATATFRNSDRIRVGPTIVLTQDLIRSYLVSF